VPNRAIAVIKAAVLFVAIMVITENLVSLIRNSLNFYQYLE
jgi:hypothetical protein